MGLALTGRIGKPVWWSKGHTHVVGFLYIKIMKHILLLALIFTPTLFASATSYNYLPNDVYIKQQEEKSALEYRISQLEASMNGSLSSSLRNVEYRIDELEREMATEINYITGVYGGYGIANQLPSKISEVEAKYESQISNLEDEREELKKLMKDETSAQTEIKRLEAELKALNETVLSTPEPEVQKPSAQSMFEYIDSLPLSDASTAYSDLRMWDPEMYSEVQYLINLKYPNGKPGSARYDEYLAKQTESIVATVPEPTQTDTYARTLSPIVAESEALAQESTSTEVIQTNTVTDNIPAVEQAQEPVVQTQPEPKQNLFIRIVNFFKSWF
jgi:hypothetical protein